MSRETNLTNIDKTRDIYDICGAPRRPTAAPTLRLTLNVHVFCLVSRPLPPRDPQVWMCGGTLEIATCSHVGHVFRKSTPYTFPGGTSHIVNHNNARLADVWLDEWKQFYFNINPGVSHSLSFSLSLTLLTCLYFLWSNCGGPSFVY